MHRNLYLVAYDVRHPTRLASALRVVKGFASGGQKSAYECWLDQNDRAALLDEISEVLNLHEDSVALIPLAPQTRMTALGTAVLPDDPDYFYIG